MSTIKKINLTAFSGTNCFADPDFLIAGMNGAGAVSNLGETIDPNAGYNVYKMQFSLWCMICAPLIMSHDPRNNISQTSKILLNKEMLAVNQDPVGIPAYVCRIDKEQEIIFMTTDVWVKPLANGDVVVGLFNRGNRTSIITAEFNSFGWLLSDTVEVYDLWEHRSVGLSRGYVKAEVAPRDCAVFRLHRQ